MSTTSTSGVSVPPALLRRAPEHVAVALRCGHELTETVQTALSEHIAGIVQRSVVSSLWAAAGLVATGLLLLGIDIGSHWQEVPTQLVEAFAMVALAASGPLVVMTYLDAKSYRRRWEQYLSSVGIPLLSQSS